MVSIKSKPSKAQKKAAQQQADAAAAQAAAAEEQLALQKQQYEENQKLLEKQTASQQALLTELAQTAQQQGPGIPSNAAEAAGAGFRKALVANRRRRRGLAGLVLSPLGGGEGGGRTTLGA